MVINRGDSQVSTPDLPFCSLDEVQDNSFLEAVISVLPYHYFHISYLHITGPFQTYLVGVANNKMSKFQS